MSPETFGYLFGALALSAIVFFLWTNNDKKIRTGNGVIRKALFLGVFGGTTVWMIYSGMGRNGYTWDISSLIWCFSGMFVGSLLWECHFKRKKLAW